MSVNVQAIRENLADGFQGLADKDTAFRDQHAEMIGEWIGESDPNWPATVALGAAIISDKTDGFWATVAKYVRGYDLSTLGGELDPIADHKLTEAMFNGMKTRAEKQGDATTTQKLESLVERTEIRNMKMDENRKRIHDFDLDKKELRASRDNKIKMVKQSLGGVALASPMSKNNHVRRVALSVIASGTKNGEKGEREFRKKVDRLTLEKLGNTSLYTEIG